MFSKTLIPFSALILLFASTFTIAGPIDSASVGSAAAKNPFANIPNQCQLYTGPSFEEDLMLIRNYAKKGIWYTDSIDQDAKYRAYLAPDDNKMELRVWFDGEAHNVFVIHTKSGDKFRYQLDRASFCYVPMDTALPGDSIYSIGLKYLDYY